MTKLACVRALTLGCLSTLGLWGCGSDEPTDTPPAPEQLEALEVAPTVDQGGAIEVSGSLNVEGQGREYALAISPEGGETVHIALHTPALSPLGALQDKTIEVELGAAEMGGRSVVLRDDAGPVYVASAGDAPGTELAEKALGAGFATWGTEVVRHTDGTFIWTYKTVVLAGDDGPVEVLPGEVATVAVDGATWRVVVIASYTVDPDYSKEALPGCEPEDMLAFEAMRATAAPEAEEPVRRLEKTQVAYIGCSAPPIDR